MIIRAGGLPRGGPVAERLLEWLAPIARVSGGRGGYPAPHLMRFFALLYMFPIVLFGPSSEKNHQSIRNDALV